MRISLDTVYCPFYEVSVKIWSDAIEKLGKLPAFILTSVEDGHITADRIVKATQLDRKTVTDTIDELMKSKLICISENENEYSYSMLGNTYLKVIKYIEAFDKTFGSRAAVNCFTGLLEDVPNEDYYNNAEPIGNALPLKISKLMIRNHNFSNIKEYLKNRVHMSEIQISDDDYQYISFSLTPKRLFYVPYYISKDAVRADGELLHTFAVSYPIETVVRFCSHRKAEQYSAVRDQIRSIASFDKNLLSAEGIEAAEVFDKLEQLSHSYKKEYYNGYTGDRLPHTVISIPVQKDHPLIRLKKKYGIKESTKEQNGFIINKKVIDETEAIKQISFDDLVQKRD